MIIFRKQIWQSVEYTEYLLSVVNSELVLPSRIPDKYLYRIQKSSKNITEVLSTPFDIAQHYKNNDVWIVANDCVAKGEFKPTNLAGISQFMGIQISKEACKLILDFDAGLTPLSLYHGTSETNKCKIVQDSLDETIGMLGNGTYLGTLWKARRFACFSQDYQKQQGVIFRVLAFANTIKTVPLQNWKCSCCQSIISDHFSKWKEEEYDGIHALACKDQSGVCKDGSAKYLLRNEEYCFKRSLLKCTHYIEAFAKQNHYDPLER